MLEIDGSILEGGGQILRIALSLSCLLKKPVKIINIRAGRPKKPGLAAQHLKGVELLKCMTNARIKGANLGSTELEFSPETINGGTYYADTGTAGSVALLLQVALPVAYFANSQTIFELKGGTNAAMAPQIDFTTEIFRRNLENFGATFDFELFKRGYFPKGGGHCQITVKPLQKLFRVQMIDFAKIRRFFGWSFVAGTLPQKLAHEITDGAKSVLEKSFSNENVKIEIESYKESPEIASNNCSGIILGCETTTDYILGGSALGQRQERPSETGKKAAEELANCVKLGACVDGYVQDQLIIFMALAHGMSRIKTTPLTLHTKTAIHVIELMTNVRFTVVSDHPASGCVFLSCNGIGHTNTLKN